MNLIEVRVERSLKRCGFTDMRVVDLGSGHVKIVGEVSCRDDRSAALVMAATVPGVTQVSSELE